MKQIFLFLLLLFPLINDAQNIQVDWTSYTAQELIEDILIDSPCIEDVTVTNVVGGNFGTGDLSYGYFDNAGSSFPFQRGIVLSTGKLINTEGPNDSLSDDDAPGWNGDADLENSLNESQTINATILEFDFKSVATQISFKYLFASEEYQANDPNTCVYSDLFGFLIRPIADTQYTNIALVPNTSTPVKVTTVHPEIVNGCPAVNEFYFESFNDAVSPINFNGQTKVMTATATVIPNETYHVKLVIADHINYRYDSAVFLEAGSFELSTDLGDDFLLANNTALCENDTYLLDATQPGLNNTYQWFKDGVLLPLETNETYTLIDAGVYTVEVTLDNSCISYGEIIVEYATSPIVVNSTLIACDLDQDGFTMYNLFDSENNITNGDSNLQFTDFFFDLNSAELNISPIPNPTEFTNTTLLQVVYARVVAQTNCISIAELELDIARNTITIQPQTTCNESNVSGSGEFDLDAITATFQNQIPSTAEVNYYESEEDAFYETPKLTSPYKNTNAFSQNIFVKITDNDQCYAIQTVVLIVFDAPKLLDDETTYYCVDTYPTTTRLFAGVLSGSPFNYTYQWFFNGILMSDTRNYIDINEIGTYTVEVTDTNNCTVSRTITVLQSASGIIQNVRIEEGTYNNSVTIEITGDGNYEFSMGDIFGPYQSENTFTNVFPGFYEIYVRDINGCAIVSETISVLGFPRFFTPNNDGANDTWEVYGVNENFNQDIELQIYDRYGKILAQLNYLSGGWDGIYNGESLPSSDYWYIAKLSDGRVYQGHFALKR
ncbi:MAG: T9SS type B sorting domain-containing protein [Urechidicola sp.]|nr:T9SS type B sorting domain-containing protein [Urechidicola sp.]